jgi:hypothetical protein
MQSIYTMIDPDWALPYDEERAALIAQSCILLARNFLTAGFNYALIASNALHTRNAVQMYLRGLQSVSQIYHFTLEADHATVVERVEQRGDLAVHSPVWLAEWLAHIRSHCEPWTQIIDTTGLTGEQVLEMIYTRIMRQAGFLTYDSESNLIQRSYGI